MTTPSEALHFYVVSRAAQDWNLDAVTEEVQREYLDAMLRRSGNNQCSVATNLGIHRNTLSRRLKKLKLDIQGQVKQRKPEELLVSAGKREGEMAKGCHKWKVIRKYPNAKLKFAQGLGYFIEVGGKHLSCYEWSPVNAWAKADLFPIFEVENDVRYG